MLTWNNNQEGKREIKERLDRALYNPKWNAMFDKTTVTHELLIGSDHCPIIIDLFPRETKKGPPFRFDTRWLKHKECSDIVEKCWREQGDCSRRLVGCQTLLQGWAKNHYSQLHEREKHK
ncbi:hypothetical protein LINPERHAP2_LOCUS25150 [Linum perenne]